MCMFLTLTCDTPNLRLNLYIAMPSVRPQHIKMIFSGKKNIFNYFQSKMISRSKIKFLKTCLTKTKSAKILLLINYVAASCTNI